MGDLCANFKFIALIDLGGRASYFTYCLHLPLKFNLKNFVKILKKGQNTKEVEAV